MKKQTNGALVVLLDLIGIGAALVVFAFFHHVLPREGTAIQNIVPIATATQLVEALPTMTPAPNAALENEIQASPTPEPTPSPTPAPGDFSASFPLDETLPDDVYGSYITQDLRIVITEGYAYEAVYFVADVWIRNISEFKTAFAKGKFSTGSYRTTIDMASDNDAIFALSGDCFGARSAGIVIRNGDLYRDSVASDVCILYADGVMESYYEDSFDLSQAIDRGAFQGWSFGPKLLDDGALPSEYNTASAISGRNPRAAIGYYEPGHYCLVLVDGRQADYSRGMSLSQLSQLFYDLGCADAYNLDGGQSAMMVFDGLIVGQPYKGGRAVSDCIYFS